MKMLYFIVTTIIILVFSAVGELDYEEAQYQQHEYCEMVNLWHRTNGESGWPEYRDDIVCGDVK